MAIEKVDIDFEIPKHHYKNNKTILSKSDITIDSVNSETINFETNQEGSTSQNVDMDVLEKLINNAIKGGTSSSINQVLANTIFKNKDGFNQYLKDSVDKAGYGTREGVVTAALALINGCVASTGEKIDYWDDAINNTSIEQMPNTEGIVNDNLKMDCSNFAWWSLYNGGFKIPKDTTWDNGQPTTSKIKLWAEDNGYNKTPGQGKGKAGDFMVMRNEDNTNGHIRLIVATDAAGYYTVEQAYSAGGTKVSHYTFDNIKKDNYEIIDMTEYYNNSSNIRNK